MVQLWEMGLADVVGPHMDLVKESPLINRDLVLNTIARRLSKTLLLEI